MLIVWIDRSRHFLAFQYNVQGFATVQLEIASSIKLLTINKKEVF